MQLLSYSYIVHRKRSTFLHPPRTRDSYKAGFLHLCLISQTIAGVHVGRKILVICTFFWWCGGCHVPARTPVLSTVASAQCFGSDVDPKFYVVLTWQVSTLWCGELPCVRLWRGSCGPITCCMRMRQCCQPFNGDSYIFSMHTLRCRTRNLTLIHKRYVFVDLTLAT